jgi:membrane protein DedA with SNARE-associated domain
MSPETAAELLGTWGYPAYVLLFLATAFGLPVTEDLLLLVGGYLVGAGIFAWPPALALAYGSLLTSDLIVYTYGRKLRAHSLRRGPVRRFVRPGRLRVATRWFGRFGEKTIFFARLVPGTRLIVFLCAGIRAVPAWKFLAYDALAALIWVPLILGVGVKIGRRIGDAQRLLEWIGTRVTWILLAAALLVLIRHLVLVRRPPIADSEVDQVGGLRPSNGNGRPRFDGRNRRRTAAPTE